MKFSLGTIFDLKQLLKELGTGLKRLDLVNNFESFELETTIPDQSQPEKLESNGDFKIRNQLTFIPNYVIIDSKGNALVTRGDTAWTKDFLYIKNHDTSNESTVKLLFLK